MCGGGDSNFLPYERGDTIRCTEAAGAAPRVGKVDEQNVDCGIAVVWENGKRSWYPYERWIEDWAKTGFRFEAVDDWRYQPEADFVLEPLRLRHWEAAELTGFANPPKRRAFGDAALADTNEEVVCEIATSAPPSAMDCGPCRMMEQHAPGPATDGKGDGTMHPPQKRRVVER